MTSAAHLATAEPPVAPDDEPEEIAPVPLAPARSFPAPPAIPIPAAVPPALLTSVSTSRPLAGLLVLILVQLFAPFSIPWAWKRYGTRGLREFGFIPPRKSGPGVVVGEDADPDPQPFQPVQNLFFNAFLIFTVIRWGFYSLFIIGGFDSVEPGDGKERGPI